MLRQPAAFWRLVAHARRYFLERDPRFANALLPGLLLTLLVYLRSPASNYIFDEQEALLANPYVNGESLGILDAFRRDFWGLPPGRSIGSYRPLPDLIWRGCWFVRETPFFPHLFNIVVHASVAALLSSFVWATTRHRGLAWLSGACFAACAVLTEAVTGVVGTADVLAGLFALLVLHSLRLGMFMPLGVFLSTALGLLSKESALVLVPLAGWAALASASCLHPKRPFAALRGLAAGLSAVAALVAYTYFRRHFFPISLPEELLQPLADDAHPLSRVMHEFLRWFQQPRLPRDPINNPLVTADFPARVAGALSVYAKGIGQVLFPWALSGDYSFAQEPSPKQLLSLGSLVGAAALLLPPLAGLSLWLLGSPNAQPRKWVLLAALALVWFPVAYFPHSNIALLLPTVRAERFWYLPAIGTSILLALTFLVSHQRWPRVTSSTALVFLGFQVLQARTHALHYSTDLTFWRAASVASSNSAKAYLNYSVMLGARGKLEERLHFGDRAISIAPSWAMAHVYRGDTLCRLRKEKGWSGKELAERAWPSYKQGFSLSPNDSNLIALGLQCLYTEEAFKPLEARLEELGSQHEGSWIEYLVRDVVENGKKNNGVAPKYRPRGYNEGPKTPGS